MPSTDAGHQSIFFLMDLSVAFNTIDHDILLDVLDIWVGISGTSLQWFRSYMKDSRFCVGVTDSRSAVRSVHCGVPIQYSAARILTGRRKHDHISPILASLHWLALQIDFNIIYIIDYSQSPERPHPKLYLRLLIAPCRCPFPSLRSSDASFLA